MLLSPLTRTAYTKNVSNLFRSYEIITALPSHQRDGSEEQNGSHFALCTSRMSPHVVGRAARMWLVLCGGRGGRNAPPGRFYLAYPWSRRFGTCEVADVFYKVKAERNALLSGRSDKIRTCDLLVPNQALCTPQSHGRPPARSIAPLGVLPAWCGSRRRKAFSMLFVSLTD